MIPGIVAGRAVEPPPPPVTWNPADKASEITLSGANLVATRSSTNNNQWRLARVTESRNSGKRYAELVNTTSVENSMMAGIVPGALSVNTYPGSSSDSFGYHANDAGPGYCYNNASQFYGDNQRVAGGSYARIAIDFDAGNLWLGNASSWKNGGDPAAGTSPSFTFTPGASLYLALGMYTQPQVVTLRLSGFSGSVPSGFTAY